MPPAAARKRWRRAFLTLGWVENLAGVSMPGRVRRYVVDGQFAVARSSRSDHLPRLLTPGIRSGTPFVTVASTRADLVRIGKFDIDETPKFLSFYRTPSPRALRVQANVDPRQPGIGRALAARTLVEAHAPGLAPRLLSSGTALRGGAAFLLEERVEGWHPWHPRHLQDTLPDLLSLLHRLQQRVGIEGRALSAVVHPDFRARWRLFTEHHDLPPSLLARVADLVDADKMLPVSLTHGDLVASNIVVTDRGPVLIDWEHARSRAVAADLAKLELLVHDPGSVVAAARNAAAAGLERSGFYPLHQQVALAHVEILSWNLHRRARAEQAHRTGDFDDLTRRRLARLGQLLAS